MEAVDKGWSANALEREIRQRRTPKTFSLPEAIAKLCTTASRTIAAWPEDARAAAPDALRELIEDLEAHDLHLTPSERHAVLWIQADMENIPFSKRNFTDAGAGRGGDLEVTGGAAGAPVYHAIIGDVSTASRRRVLHAVDNLLAGKLTPVGDLVLGVARDLADGKRSVVRQMVLPPEAGGDLRGTVYALRGTLLGDGKLYAHEGNGLEEM